MWTGLGQASLAEYRQARGCGNGRDQNRPDGTMTT